MIPHLEIKNFGPIKAISIPLNRVMVFMGPQSSGKSTIAKIISFCRWLEKEAVYRHTVSHVNPDFMKLHLTDYYFFDNYLNEGWEISYKSDIIKFTYSADVFMIEVGDGFSTAKLSKNAYIPSERNCISIGGLKSLEMKANYQRSFIFEWFDTLPKCVSSHEIDLPAMDTVFYYDADRKAPLARIANGKELQMYEVSSGLQSVIPLLVLFSNLTQWVYESSGDVSYEQREDIKKVILRAMLETTGVDSDTIETSMRILGDNLPKELSDKLSNLMKIENSNSLPINLRTIIDTRDNLSRVYFSNIVLEEPELNLFPETQISLIYRILRMIDVERDNVVITTHSSYILYAINNCLLGHKVKDSLPKDKAGSMFEDSWVDSSLVSIYQIEDGRLISPEGECNATIQAPDGLLRKNYFDSIMGDLMKDFRKLLVYYPD